MRPYHNVSGVHNWCRAWLRAATTQLAEAEQERIWAIVTVHQAGLSIR